MRSKRLLGLFAQELRRLREERIGAGIIVRLTAFDPLAFEIGYFRLVGVGSGGTRNRSFEIAERLLAGDRICCERRRGEAGGGEKECDEEFWRTHLSFSD